jgi:hypothetical protein
LQDHLGDGYLVERGSSTYGDYAVIKLKVTKANADGSIVPEIEDDFNRWAATVGLEPSDFGARFRSRGHLYQIVGMKPRNRKYPILVKRVASNGSLSNSTYKLSDIEVLEYKEMGGRFWTKAE